MKKNHHKYLFGSRSLVTIIFLFNLLVNNFVYAINLKEGKTFEQIKHIETSKVILDAMADPNQLASLLEAVRDEDPSSEHIKYLFVEEKDCVYVKLEFSDVLQSFYYDSTAPLFAKQKYRTFSVDSKKNFSALTYVVREKGSSKVVGNIEIHNVDGGKTPEIGIFIGKKFAGKGIGSAATAAILGMIKEFIDTDEVIWNCNKKNDASVKTALRAGFVLESNDHEEEQRYVLKI